MSNIISNAISNWKEKIAAQKAENSSTSTSIIKSPSIDLSQLDKYNIVKQINELKDRLKNTGERLFVDLQSLQNAGEKLTASIVSNILLITDAVNNIGVVLKGTTSDLSDKTADLAGAMYNGAKKIYEPAIYIKDQIQAAADDISHMKNDIDRGIDKYWEAIKHAADAINNFKDGLLVMTASSEHGGPLFVQLVKAFENISSAAVSLKHSFKNFATENYVTIKQSTKSIQTATNAIKDAIINYSNSFVAIFTNLATNIRGS